MEEQSTVASTASSHYDDYRNSDVGNVEVESTSSNQLKLVRSAPVPEKPNRKGLLGGISEDGEFSWIAHSSTLQIVDLNTHKVISFFDFGEDRILCCSIVSLDSRRAFAVGFKGQTIKILDYSTSRILGTMKLPFAPVVLFPLRKSGSDSLAPLNDRINALRCPAIVGTNTGRVLVVDLESYTNANADNMMEEDTSNDYFVMNSGSFENNNFRFISANKEDPLPETKIEVSALFVIERLNILAVGFSFGGYQLWSLSTLQMTFSGIEREQHRKLPVTNFCYQELHAFDRQGYLWIGHNSNPRFDNSSNRFAKITLFTLDFNINKVAGSVTVSTTMKKEFIRVLGQDVQSTQPDVNDLDASLYSVLVSAFVIPNAKMGEVGTTTYKDITRAAFVWEVVRRQNSRRQLHMEVFDMNRWFSGMDTDSDDETHGRGNANASANNFKSYFHAYPMSRISTDKYPLLAVWVDENSVFQVTEDSGSPLPINVPALSFDVTALTQVSAYTIQFAAPAYKVLNEVATRGGSSFDPKEREQVHKQCQRAGLLPKAFNISQDEVALHDLLTQAWKNDLTPAITHYINSLRERGYSEIGEPQYYIRDPHPVFEWVQFRHREIEDQCQALIPPFFQVTGVTSLEPNEKLKIQEKLHDMSHQLHSLRLIVSALEERANPMIEEEKQALNKAHATLSKNLAFLNVVEWFIGHGLLPLASGLYNFNKLKQICDNRRETNAKAILPTIESVSPEMVPQISSDNPHSETLFVDALVQLATGSPNDETLQYPPESLERLFHLFMMDDNQQSTKEQIAQSIAYKHLVVFYLLVDLFHTLRDENGNALISFNLLNLYARQFHISDTWQHLVFGLWLLDSKQNLEQATFYVCKPDSPNIPREWFRDLVVEVLLSSRAPSCALRACNAWNHCESPVLEMRVFLENHMIGSAFDLQRRYENDQATRRVLLYLLFEYSLEAAGSTSAVQQLYGLPFDQFEDACLVKYLLSKPFGMEGQDEELERSKRRDLLLVYYVTRSRYIEFLRLYNQFPPSHDPTARQFNAMMKDNIELLIPESQKMLTSATTSNVAISGGATRIAPLAVSTKHHALLRQSLSSTTKDAFVSPPSAANYRQQPRFSSTATMQQAHHQQQRQTDKGDVMEIEREQRTASPVLAPPALAAAAPTTATRTAPKPIYRHQLRDSSSILTATSTTTSAAATPAITSKATSTTTTKKYYRLPDDEDANDGSAADNNSYQSDDNNNNNIATGINPVDISPITNKTKVIEMDG